MGIFKSLGIKRYVTALIGLLLSVASGVPSLAPVVVLLTKLNAALGVVGVAHAAGAGTVFAQIPATLASIVAVLVAVAQQVPQFAPYLPILQLLLAALGGATLTKGLTISK